MTKLRALFLDRDGTINIDKHYVYRIEDFEWVPGIIELCQKAQSLGYLIIIITNQSGIERGYFTEEEYKAFTHYMCTQFAKHDIEIAEVLHCPYLNHSSRKPSPELFVQVAKRRGIDMCSSISLGDKLRDVQAGVNAGVGRNYLLAPPGMECEIATAVVTTPQEIIPFL